MGIFDKVRDKASELARTKGARIDQTVDRTAEVINRRTQGKHAGKVQSYAERAKEGAERLGRRPPR